MTFFKRTYFLVLPANFNNLVVEEIQLKLLHAK